MVTSEREEIDRLKGQLEITSRIRELMISGDDDTMYADVLDLLLKWFECEHGFFGYIDADGSLVCPSMTRQIWTQCQVEEKSIIFAREMWGGLWGRVLLEKRGLLKNAPHKVPKGHLPLDRSMGAPIVLQDELLGSIHLGSRDRDFTQEDLEELEYFIAGLAPCLAMRIGRGTLRVSQRKAERQAAFFRWVTESVPYVIYQYREDQLGNRSFPYMSARIQQMFGVTAEQVYADPHLIFTMLHEEDAEQLYSSIAESARTLQPWSCDFRIHVGGEIKWIHGASNPTANSDGSISWDGVLTDYSELKRKELELVRLKEEAEAANRAKSVFLANMSHELRTPLNAILGFSKLILLEKYGPLTELLRSRMESVEESGSHLLTLISDLLDMSRIEAGRVSLNPIRLRLRHLIGDIGDMLSAPLREQQMELVVSCPDDLWILADPDRTKQVISNLVSNAIKFNRTGGKIGIDVSRDDTETLVVVWDEGIGIDVDHHGTIFREFFQVEQTYTRRFAGMGLGLAIAKRIVELQGGRIWVESELNHGCRFHFTLPNPPGEVASRTPASQDTQAPASSESGEEAASDASSRILLVDDDERGRMLSEEILKDAGFDVVCAADGTQARQRIKEGAFGLVLLDIQLPDIDGPSLLREFRADPQIKDLRVVALTAYAMNGDRNRFLRDGFDDYVSKPVDADLLVETVSKNLKIAQSQDNEN